MSSVNRLAKKHSNIHKLMFTTIHCVEYIEPFNKGFTLFLHDSFHTIARIPRPDAQPSQFVVHKVHLLQQCSSGLRDKCVAILQEQHVYRSCRAVLVGSGNRSSISAPSKNASSVTNLSSSKSMLQLDQLVLPAFFYPLIHFIYSFVNITDDFLMDQLNLLQLLHFLAQ